MLVVRTKRDNRQRVAFFKARRTGRRRKEIKEKKKKEWYAEKEELYGGMEMKKIERREEERDVRFVKLPLHRKSTSRRLVRSD